MVAFLASALVSEYHYVLDRSVINNTSLSVIVEYGVYIPLLAYLIYRDNSSRYREDGRILWSNLMNYIKKLLATLSTAEICYIAIRGYMHYNFIQNGVEPYQAVLFSSIIASVAFYTVINTGASLTRIFK